MKNLLSCLFIVALFACDATSIEEEETCSLTLEELENYSCSLERTFNVGESILTEEQDETYLNIWKALLLEKTGMTEIYFNTHFKNVRTSSHEWNSGKTFKITYDFELDWLKVTHTDDFLVYMNSSVSAYQHHNIPRNQYLDESWIKFFVEETIASSSMAFIEPIESLAFSNCKEVVEFVRAETGYLCLTPTRYTYLVASKRPRIDGYPYMILFGIDDPVENECTMAYINLFDKTVARHETVCYIKG